MAGNVVVGGSASVYTLTFQNALNFQNVAQVTTKSASLTCNTHTATFSTSTAGSSDTRGTFKAHVRSASDGSQYATCIMDGEVSTDCSGNIYYANTVGAGSHEAAAAPNATLFIHGAFKITDLVMVGAGALASSAVDQLGGHRASCSIAEGVLVF